MRDVVHACLHGLESSACPQLKPRPRASPERTDVKNKRGQHSRGKKVTGLAFLPSQPGKLLITSNDSRVR